MELEKKVLKGIIDFLDEQEGESLKKHPKLKKEAPKVEEKKESVKDMSEDDLSPDMIQKILEMHEKMSK